MQKKLNSKRSRLGRITIGLALVLAMTAAAGTGTPTRAEQNDDQRAFGLSTGLVGIVPGQRARLTLWNKGEQAVLARLQFVDEQGKVLIQCNEIIQPGKAGTLEYSLTFNGNLRTELQAQFGTNAKRSIGLLMPTFQVIDNATGATSWMIGQDGFAEFRPIFNPPLVAPW